MPYPPLSSQIAWAGGLLLIVGTSDALDHFWMNM